MKKKAVFLDRDGTIIEERNYLSDPDGVVLIPSAAGAIRKLSENGYLIIMVSNQAGVAKGKFPEEAVHQVNQRVQQLLQQEGASIDAMYYCPHHPDGIVEPYHKVCNCRKPAPGMGLLAAKEHDIDLSMSYMIGDKALDVLFGRNCGMKNAFLVSTGYGKEEVLPADYGMFVADIGQAAEQIIQENKTI